MNKDQTNQPLPTEEPKGEQGPLAQTTPSTFSERLKKFRQTSPKGKLILVLGAFTVVMFILITLLSLGRRPPGQPRETVLPTPTPIAVQPTPTLTQTQTEAQELLEKIEDLDPSGQDLQPPVVDLQIGL